jgi:MFS family permease
MTREAEATVSAGGTVAHDGTIVPTESLLAGPFRLFWPASFLIYGLDAVLRALVPVIALDRGGDAVLVGLLGTAFAIPSVLFRPIVGSLVDSWQHRLVLRSAALGVATLLLPGSLALLVGRFLYGSAWAAYSVSNHALLAKLAPPARRAEASGGYLTAGGIGALILPGLGVALYTGTGVELPILFVLTLGLAGVLVVARIAVPATGPQPGGAGRTPGGNAGRTPGGNAGGITGGASGGTTARNAGGTAGEAATGARKEPLLTRFFEPSAVPGAILLVTTYSAWSIFTVFPAVYAEHVNEPVEVLIAYFPIFGLAQVLFQPFVGRLGDRLGRARSMISGATIAAVGLLVAMIPGFATFTAAAVIYAIAQSLVMATVSALTMERAPKHRLGSAMATYSVGFQVATGISSLAWGAMINSVGFGWVFAAALALQVLTIALALRFLMRR